MSVNLTANLNTGGLPSGNNNPISSSQNATNDTASTNTAVTSTKPSGKTTSTNPTTSLASILGKNTSSAATPNYGGMMMALAAIQALGQLSQAFSGLGTEEASEEDGEKKSNRRGDRFNEAYAMQDANGESMQEHGGFSVEQVHETEGAEG